MLSWKARARRDGRARQLRAGDRSRRAHKVCRMEQVVKVNTGRGQGQWLSSVESASACVLFFHWRVVGSGGTGALEGIEIRSCNAGPRDNYKMQAEAARGREESEGEERRPGGTKEGDRQVVREAGWMATVKWVAHAGWATSVRAFRGGPLDDPALPASYCSGCKLKPRPPCAAAPGPFCAVRNACPRVPSPEGAPIAMRPWAWWQVPACGQETAMAGNTTAPRCPPGARLAHRTAGIPRGACCAVARLTSDRPLRAATRSQRRLRVRQSTRRAGNSQSAHAARPKPRRRLIIPPSSASPPVPRLHGAALVHTNDWSSKPMPSVGAPRRPTLCKPPQTAAQRADSRRTKHLAPAGRRRRRNYRTAPSNEVRPRANFALAWSQSLAYGLPGPGRGLPVSHCLKRLTNSHSYLAKAHAGTQALAKAIRSATVETSVLSLGRPLPRASAASADGGGYSADNPTSPSVTNSSRSKLNTGGGHMRSSRIEDGSLRRFTNTSDVRGMTVHPRACTPTPWKSTVAGARCRFQQFYMQLPYCSHTRPSCGCNSGTADTVNVHVWRDRHASASNMKSSEVPSILNFAMPAYNIKLWSGRI
ncbi:hypothetical protein PSPO01_07981 [Paraphaeosphaeria sporulosa]